MQASFVLSLFVAGSIYGSSSTTMQSTVALCLQIRTKDLHSLQKKKTFRKPHAMLGVMVCCVLGCGM